MEKTLFAGRKRHNISSDTNSWVKEIAINDSHILLAFMTDSMKDSQKCDWYKCDISNQTVAFIKEGPYQEENHTITKNLWFSEYLDFAKEFPSAFGIEPGSAEWRETVKGTMLEKAVAMAKEQYGEELCYWEPYRIAAENNTHVLIFVRTQSLSDTYKCAWYKGNCDDGTVIFVREGPYVKESLQPGSWTSEPLRIAEYLWLKEYRDFAKEFPSLYGDPDEIERPDTSDPPYTFEFSSPGIGYGIFDQPSYEGNVKGHLPDSYNALVIVEEQYDKEYNLWGKLESGEGWICISDILSGH